MFWNDIIYYVRRYRWVKSQPNLFALPVKLVRKANYLGFTSSEYVIYNLDHNNHKDYLREFERQEFRRKIASPYKMLLDNKVLFYSIIRNFVETNEIFCFKKKGNFVMLKDDFGTEVEAVLSILAQRGKVVFKKMSDGGGHGFANIEMVGMEYKINGKPVVSGEVEEFLNENDNYLIEEFCTQSSFENALFPYSVNTIRLVTVENANGDYDIAYALQRMGADVKSNVDNASGGVFFQKLTSKKAARCLRANGTIHESPYYWEQN